MKFWCAFQYAGRKQHQEIGLHPLKIHFPETAHIGSDERTLYVPNHRVANFKLHRFCNALVQRNKNAVARLGHPAAPFTLQQGFAVNQRIAVGNPVFPCKQTL